MESKILDKELKAFFGRITKEEAKRGIYIDFEGFEDKAPTMLGIQIDGKFTQVIFDERLEPAAKEKGLSVEKPKVFLANLIRQAKQESRRIFAYSQHENNIFREFYSLDLDPFYCDVRFVAKKLKSKKYPTYELKSRELKKYLEMIGFERPKNLGIQKSTKRIRDVINGLEKNNNNFSQLTSTQKSKWTNLLKHNKCDVKGMEAIVKDYLKAFQT